MECSRTHSECISDFNGSNNTNKWNAQEHNQSRFRLDIRSNNTNKWNAQEQMMEACLRELRSNNTNKWNAQELTLNIS